MKTFGQPIVAVIAAIIFVVVFLGIASYFYPSPLSREEQATKRAYESAARNAWVDECKSEVDMANIAMRPGRTDGADNAIDAMEGCAADHGHTLDLRGKKANTKISFVLPCPPPSRPAPKVCTGELTGGRSSKADASNPKALCHCKSSGG